MDSTDKSKEKKDISLLKKIHDIASECTTQFMQ